VATADAVLYAHLARLPNRTSQQSGGRTPTGEVTSNRLGWASWRL